MPGRRAEVQSVNGRTKSICQAPTLAGIIMVPSMTGAFVRLSSVASIIRHQIECRRLHKACPDTNICTCVHAAGTKLNEWYCHTLSLVLTIMRIQYVGIACRLHGFSTSLNSRLHLFIRHICSENVTQTSHESQVVVRDLFLESRIGSRRSREARL